MVNVSGVDSHKNENQKQTEGESTGKLIQYNKEGETTDPGKAIQDSMEGDTTRWT